MRGPIARALAAGYRRLLPERAKNTLRAHLAFEERDKPARVIDTFPERRVLVLAPHMDDEVIGCGGAVRRHALAGAEVTVVFLTDGRRGDVSLYERSDLSASEVRTAEVEHAAARRIESERASEILGTGELVFLDAEDGALENDPELAERLAVVLRRVRPELVYLPSLLDSHEDHWMTNVVFLAAAESAAALLADCRLRQYEVWTPLIPNAVVDVAEVLDDKRRALEAFASQAQHLDVVALSLALARYRSMLLPRARGGGAAEAFWDSDQAGHRAVYERYRSS